MTTRVYRYGCVPPTGPDLELIIEQLHLAHRYRLMLWHLARASRALYRERRSSHFPELEHTEAEIARLGELLGMVEDKREKQPLRIELERLKARARELRQVAKDDPAFNALVAADREREGVLKRALRGAFSSMGLYSGTYLCVEDADKRSRSGKHDPARPWWNGTGVLAVQLQGGRTATDVLRGSDPSIHVRAPQREGKGRRSGSRSTIRYRVCSRDRKPVCIELKAMIDRDLPADARVTWAKLVVAKCGASAIGRPRYAYSVQLTIESVAFARTELGAGEVAVCFADDLVTYAGEGETHRVFPVPAPFAKVRDLQSIRDKNRNSAVGLISAWTERLDDVPEWLLDEVAANADRASCRRAVRLVQRIAAANEAGELDVDERLLKKLRAWVYQENHLYQWQEDARASWLRKRKNDYRVWAAELRRKYRHVLLDSRRLDDPALKTEERNSRGLHELRLAIKHSFGPDYVFDVTGRDCAEMFERFRAAQREAAE